MNCRDYDRVCQMDIILKEVDSWIANKNTTDKINSIKFQNHLYGCIAILEIIAERDDASSNTIVDLSNNLLIQKDESVDNHNKPFNFKDDFNKIGTEHGFFYDERSSFDGWKEEYRNAWIQIWNTLGYDKNMEQIDSLESEIFKKVHESDNSHFEYFYTAVENSCLTDELEDKATEIFDSFSNLTAKIKKIEKFKHTRKNSKQRRNVTPISRLKLFKKTRKHKS